MFKYYQQDMKKNLGISIKKYFLKMEIKANIFFH